ncbi:hypothetical protein ABIA32_000474 [Streptacidiphilus sp. MAP12-20]|uniref:putative Ig domain-containing protein n=1 Tax=Streptacidiphilus sp. MAP12-20 TaxID=3156299 RepID=UPI0035115DD6
MSRSIPRSGRIAALAAMLAALPALWLSPATAHAATPVAAGPTAHLSPDSKPAVHHDTSRPLRDLAREARAHPAPAKKHKSKDHEERLPHPPASRTPDPVVQHSTGGPAAATSGTSFEGIGSGNYSITGVPPDPNAAVGSTQIVEVVNTAYAVYSKSGATVLAPTNTNSLWSGFGGFCQSANDGDATVRWDNLAQRWVLQQFANVTSSAGPYYECVAVSTSADATGTWNRYSYQFSSFPDYPKLSVWPDAYYTTYNMFTPAGAFIDAEACAMDRASMLTGAAATQQCFTTSSSYGGILGSDVDGSTAPPSGEPELMVGLGTTSTTLAYWKFHVDWATPANSTFTGPSTLTVAAYTTACGSTGTCIPQGGTTQQLDSLSDRVMYRLAYRNYGDHESLVVNDSVTAGSSVGSRWYELRMSGGNPTVYQQGTYAPDSTYRWMGSMAQDKAGNIALGYSQSSASTNPSIRFTGRLAGDALGTMTQGETTVLTGGGVQTSYSRWGDYTSMAIDPSDDCTYWYTDEYEPSTGSFNWNTHISSFTLPNCTGTPVNDFSMSLSPASASVTSGAAATSTVSTAVTSGSAQTVNLTASGLPTGATAAFSPTSVTAGGSSTLTVSTTSSTPAGSYSITVTGTGASATHTATFSLTVTAGGNTVTVTNPGSQTGTVGTAASLQIHATDSASGQTLTYAASGLPAGLSINTATGLISGTPTTAGTSSVTVTVRDTTGANGSATFTWTINPSGGGGGITNGGFETGSLSGWTASGAATGVTTSGPHSGTYAAMLGSTSPTNGDSSIAQTFTVPTGSNTLSFWYNVTCPDTVTYDWATATLKDNTSNTTSTVLAKTCVSSSGWTQVSSGVTAGHSYTLTLTSHDDNYAGDPTYTKYDDVALSTSGGGGGGITNGGFEAGNLSGWTASGAATGVTTTNPHSGSDAAMLGSTSPTNGDSSIAQTFTAPSGASKVSFYYNVTCPDTVTYDWATATLKDNTSNTTTTVLAKTCVSSSGWTQVSSSVTAGHSYTLTLTSHDDNYAGDPTYTTYDDVTLA